MEFLRGGENTWFLYFQSNVDGANTIEVVNKDKTAITY